MLQMRKVDECLYKTMKKYKFVTCLICTYTYDPTYNMKSLGIVLLIHLPFPTRILLF